MQYISIKDSNHKYNVLNKLLDSIMPPPVSRYFAESDGDSWAKTYYVTHTAKNEHISCYSMKEAIELAAALNDTQFPNLLIFSHE